VVIIALPQGQDFRSATSNTTLMHRAPARLAARCVAVAAIAGSASMLLLPGGTAVAATTKVGVLQQAWFWQNAYEQANPPVAQAAPATEPSGVPDGDLAVAYTGSSNKSSSKMTALSFDVSSLTPGSSVQSFTFSLTIDGAPGATTFDAASAAVVACLPTRSWPAQLGGDYTNQPGVDCAQKVTPVVNGSTYTFKIPAIAQTWVDDQNLGVAILVDADTAAAPFQLVFSGAKDVKADMSYTPASSAGSSSGSSAVAVPAGSGSGPVGPSDSAPAPMPPVTGDTTAAAPAAAAPVVAAQPAAIAAKTVAAAKTAPAVPAKAFWAAALVLALILLAASLVLGDPAPIAAGAATPSRLDRVLRARATL
jgi:hypothetical protein